MTARLYHLQINVARRDAALPSTRSSSDTSSGGPSTRGREWPLLRRGGDIWLIPAAPALRRAGFHRKGAGLNHLAFRVERREEVDRFRDEFLAPRGVGHALRHSARVSGIRPGYYAVFFEDPDRLKLEVVHMPPRH